MEGERPGSVWFVTEIAPVNAFVTEGEPIPQAGRYDDGYSIAVGSDPQQRVRLEKRSQ